MLGEVLKRKKGGGDFGPDCRGMEVFRKGGRGMEEKCPGAEL